MHDFAMIQQQYPIAHNADAINGMRDEDYRSSLFLNAKDLTKTLVLERQITDGKNLIDQQDIGVAMNRYCKSKTNVHARRIRAYGSIDEISYFGKIDDLMKPTPYFFRCHAEDGSVEINILTSCHVRMKAGSDRD